jgi:UDP-N-acetylglucosamine:LPS N-acetylglucosamine transferase
LKLLVADFILLSLVPGTTYDLLDVVEKDGVPPYNFLVSYYKHLSAHPSQWKLVYSFSNSRAFEMLADAHLKLMCERAVRRRIQSYDPDVVVSVHPLMTNVPVLSCQKISEKTGKQLPIFTVVTDLGSAHCLWFANGVEKMFVGSEKVKQLAKERGRVPEEKLVMAGLPIRHDFSIQADLLGDRHSEQGKLHQQKVRRDLELPHDRKTILVMGGGEGVGSLSNLVDSLYVELVAQGIDALVLVVCGRNMKLKDSLDKRDWVDVCNRFRAAKERVGISKALMSLDLGHVCGDSLSSVTPGCIESRTVTGSLRRMLSHGSMKNAVVTPLPCPNSLNDEIQQGQEDEKKATDTDTETEDTVPSVDTATYDDSLINTNTNSALEDEMKTPGQVSVVGLGFVTQMAEYMVAADVLVSKAGPGTISEAAALALPVMLTSFLPGQEEGNIDFVIEGGFGAYCADSDPIGVAEEVCMWLTDNVKHSELSRAAKAQGAPHAARDIAQMIGDSTLKWIKHNEQKATATAEE